MITVTTTFDLALTKALDSKKIRREFTLFKTRFNTVLREEYQKADFGNELIARVSEYPPERTTSPNWKSDRQRTAAIIRMRATGRVRRVGDRTAYQRSYDYQRGWLTELNTTNDGSDLRVYNVVEYGGYVGGTLVLYSGAFTIRQSDSPDLQSLIAGTQADTWQQAFHRAQGWVTVAPIVQSSIDQFVNRVIERFNLNTRTLAERGLLFAGVRPDVQTGLENVPPSLGLGR